MGNKGKKKNNKHATKHDVEIASEFNNQTETRDMEAVRGLDRLEGTRIVGDDVETAAELTPSELPIEASKDEHMDVDGTGIGVTALIFSLAAFFLFPFVLSAVAIVLGIMAIRRGSAMGWWAAGIGAFVLLIRVIAFPILAIF